MLLFFNTPRPSDSQPVRDLCRTTWMPWWVFAMTAWKACSTSASSPAWQPVPSPSCCVPSPGPGDRSPAGEWAPSFLPSCFQQLFWEKKCQSGAGLFIDGRRFLLLVPMPVFWAGFFLFFSCQSPLISGCISAVGASEKTPQQRSLCSQLRRGGKSAASKENEPAARHVPAPFLLQISPLKFYSSGVSTSRWQHCCCTKKKAT